MIPIAPHIYKQFVYTRMSLKSSLWCIFLGGGCGEVGPYAVHDDLPGGVKVQGAQRDDGPGVPAPSESLPLLLHWLQQGQAGPHRRHPQDPSLGQVWAPAPHSPDRPPAYSRWAFLKIRDSKQPSGCSSPHQLISILSELILQQLNPYSFMWTDLISWFVQFIALCPRFIEKVKVEQYIGGTSPGGREFHTQI